MLKIVMAAAWLSEITVQRTAYVTDDEVFCYQIDFFSPCCFSNGKTEKCLFCFDE